MKFLLALILIMVLVASGCTSQTISSDNTQATGDDNVQPAGDSDSSSVLAECEEKNYPDTRNYCYSTKADETSNPDLCGMITSETSRDACFRKLGIKLNDISLCDKVNTPHLKDGCIELVSINTENPDGCDRVVDEDERATCFSEIAKQTGDASLCDRITSSDESEYNTVLNKKDGCYYSVATNTNDIAPCYKFWDDYAPRRNECLCKIAINTLNESIAALIDTGSAAYYECKREWPGTWPLD